MKESGGAVERGRGAVTLGKSVLSTNQFGWMPARSCVACAAATSARKMRVNMQKHKEDEGVTVFIQP